MRELLEMGPLDRPLTRTASLGVVTSLFRRFHAEEIPYCNWKSNEHLDASMLGDTDFDLLVDPRAALPVAGILSQMDVKRFVVAPFHQYPGVEDYVCFDRDASRLIHLHLHYQPTVGEKWLKGYRLPWEEVVLSTRMLHERHEIYVADPNVEMLLLVARAAVKLRWRDRLLAGRRRSYFPDKVVKEFAWLARMVEHERLLGLARPLVGEKAARLLAEMVGPSAPSKRQLVAFRRSAEPDLAGYRTYSVWGARPRRWLREARTLWWWLENRYYRVPGNSSRTCPQGGVMIAVVGADGAGKSSIAKAIAEWLSQEVAVLPIAAARHVPMRAWRARDLGKIVILDGWPDSEARPPDVVVRLRVASDVAQRRRPPGPTEQPPGHVADVQHVRYPPSTRVVEIDANQPVERVLSEAKHAVWDSV